jgi:cytochrome c556
MSGMNRKRVGVAVALAVGLGVAAGGAFAHEHMGPMPKTAGAKAAYQRHENFKQQGAAFKAINDELKKDAPDKALIASNANKLKTLTTQLPSWFPKGSGPESGFKTDAKAEVWSDAAGFAAAVNRLQVESSKLQQVSATGDLAAIRAQVRATGGACKNCHDKYRVPEKK